MSDTKTVFRLRKARQYPEALAMARELYARDKADPWAVKALGWVLYDMIKEGKNAVDQAAIRQMQTEFVGLAVPADDEILRKCQAYVAAQPAADDPDLAAAKQAEAAGRFPEAAALYGRMYARNPASFVIARSYGWALYRCLKSVADDAGTEARQRALGVIIEYMKIKELERPSVLHSHMLRLATRAAAGWRQYTEFIQWWDLRNLRDEDYQPWRPEKSEEVYPSLAERVAQALFKSVKADAAHTAAGWVAEFIADQCRRFPDNEWLPYYHGMTLIWAGHADQARVMIMPLVRAKNREFWAWSLLAQVTAEVPLKIACLCRAMLCPLKDEGFRVGTHEELAGVLKEAGNYSAALYEYQTAIALRETHKWRVDSELRIQAVMPEFAGVTAAPDNRALYEEHAPRADEVLAGDLPWVDAVVTGIVPPREDKRGLLFLGYVAERELRQVPIPMNKVTLPKLPAKGEPVRIKLFEAGERQNVVVIERRGGEAWDLLAWQDGVASHVNREQQVAHITMGLHIVVSIGPDACREFDQLQDGDAMRVKMYPQGRDGRFSAAVAERSGQPLPPKLARTFGGTLELATGGFGFVDHVFIPPAMVGAHPELTTGMTVKGIAVCQWNAKRNEAGWVAVRVDAGHEHRTLNVQHPTSNSEKRNDME